MFTFVLFGKGYRIKNNKVMSYENVFTIVKEAAGYIDDLAYKTDFQIADWAKNIIDVRTEEEHSRDFEVNFTMFDYKQAALSAQKEAREDVPENKTLFTWIDDIHEKFNPAAYEVSGDEKGIYVFDLNSGQVVGKIERNRYEVSGTDEDVISYLEYLVTR